MITENQAKALATLLHELRPRWSTPAMLKLLEKNAQHPAPFADITVAAVNAARDHKVETPGAIFIDQRFWPDTIKAVLPKPPPCPDHVGQYAHNCICCAADRKAEPPPTYESENEQ